MGKPPETVKVAVVQASPVLFDREATLNKTCDLIQAPNGSTRWSRAYQMAFLLPRFHSHSVSGL
jgi:hypothetical protein